MEQIGRYQVEREIGRGAMGVVYRALDPAIGRTVAIKTIRLAEFADPTEQGRLRERLTHEARSAGVLSHPGIVTVYDVAEEEELSYIAMEFVNGPSLEQMLSGSEPLDRDTILRVLRETASALDYAHKKGIVHRDIKPANILVHEDGTVKITDFGVAKISASHQLTQAGTVLGTPSYMSPEQVQGKPVDGRSDVFSLAVIAYEMLTGEKPFTGEQLPTLVYKIVHDQPTPPHLINPTLPWHVGVVLNKALEKDPAARYATCAEFVKALEGACKSARKWKPLPRGSSQALPTVITEAPAPVSARRRREERRAWTWKKKTALAAGVAVIGIGAFAALHLRPWERPAPPPPQPAESQTVEPEPVSAGRPSPAGPAAGEEQPSAAIVTPPPVETEPPPVKTEPPPPTEQSAPTKPPEKTPAPAQPQTPPSLDESVVLVRTSPPGASIVFDSDSRKTCKSPCSFGLFEGRHTVSARMPGHRSALRIFQVPRDVDLFLYLAPMTGQVQVLTTPSGASILINGQPRKETSPATLELPVGKYTVSVVREGYRKDQQSIEVKDNAFVRLDFVLGK